MNILLDCDPGHDDAFALMLAARTAELVGITTVSGNASLESVTRNALAILALLEVDVPVCAGAATPLEGEPLHAPEVHGETGLGDAPMPYHDRTVSPEPAVDFIIRMSHEAAPLWLVAVGPLTNVAHALARDPGLATRLAGISIMGGSTSGGNRTAAAEFNILVDPEAAAQVFAAGARLLMCGLNLTYQFRSDDTWIAQLEAADTALGRFSASLLKDVHARLHKLLGVQGAALHDPCAVMAVTHPEWFKFVPRRVQVECRGEYTRGMTLVDERPGLRSTNAEVAYSIDAERAAAWVLQYAC